MIPTLNLKFKKSLKWLTYKRNDSNHCTIQSFLLTIHTGTTGVETQSDKKFGSKDENEDHCNQGVKQNKYSFNIPISEGAHAARCKQIDDLRQIVYFQLLYVSTRLTVYI